MKGSHFFKGDLMRATVVFVLVFVSAGLFYQAIERPVKIGPANDVVKYNQGVEEMFLKGEDALSSYIISQTFSKAKGLSDKGSAVDAYSNYNLAYISTSSKYAGIIEFRVAREFLMEALRAKPNDYDIQFNLELITRRLIEMVTEEMMEADPSLTEAEAEDKAIEQETGELPVNEPGDGYSPGGGDESGY